MKIWLFFLWIFLEQRTLPKLLLTVITYLTKVNQIPVLVYWQPKLNEKAWWMKSEVKRWYIVNGKWWMDFEYVIILISFWRKSYRSKWLIFFGGGGLNCLNWLYKNNQNMTMFSWQEYHYLFFFFQLVNFKKRTFK